jgi:nucleotide-binding universal stress UspA family protein
MQDYQIVVGVDGSECSRRALRWAAHEADTRGGTIRAIIAYDWGDTEANLLAGPSPEAERHHAEEILDEAVTEIRREYAGIAMSAEVQMGNPARKLTEAARDAYLLVVGSHGHGHVHQAVLGSVSEACIRHATCPVVVVPAPHPEPAHTGTA